MGPKHKPFLSLLRAELYECLDSPLIKIEENCLGSGVGLPQVVKVCIFISYIWVNSTLEKRHHFINLKLSLRTISLFSVCLV